MLAALQKTMPPVNSMTAESLCNLLVLTRLFPADAARSLFQRGCPAARSPDDAKRFAEWLVANRYLTEYQAGLLLGGHRKGYFVGQYRVLERIGRGRVAGVYKATDPNGRGFALKVLPPSRAAVPETLARFQREARLAMQLDHPNVVKTFNLGQDGKLHFIVMEHLEGASLQEILEDRKALPPGEAARIGLLAALGLQHVCERSMVHRDLNPANLMLVPAPGPGQSTLRAQVKLVDIGLGRMLFDPTSLSTTEGLTNEEDLLGTPDYLAPEQARDARRADIRSDVYSLGCTLYHALAGRPPFPDDNPIRQVLRHANEQPRPLPEIRVEVPPTLDCIVATMLAKDPAQRYQTPALAAKALQAFLASQPG
jgi:serine/threonine protein kinase